MRMTVVWLAVACALGVTGCQVEEVRQFVDDVRVVARVGVLADVEFGGGRPAPKLRKALEFFRAGKVDAVAFAGQVTADGYADQVSRLKLLWNEVFAGTETRLIMGPGVFEVGGFSFELAAKRPYAKCDRLTFYGGRKLALTDELCLYPRDSRVVCAGSMSGVEQPGGFADPGQRRKAAGIAQGLLVSVYSDQTVLRRLDFTGSSVDDVAQPWVVDANGVVPEAAERAEFHPDATVQVLPGFQQNRPIYTVRWSCAGSGEAGARARWYEVAAAFADRPEAVFLQRNVLSDGFAFSEKRDRAPVKTVFQADGMPEANELHQEAVFTVTPIGCYGARGRTIVSPPVPLLRKGD